MKCVSCGKRVVSEKSWIEFDCPQCGETKIVRCEKCKSLGNQYECGVCHFVGP